MTGETINDFELSNYQSQPTIEADQKEDISVDAEIMNLVESDFQNAGEKITIANNVEALNLGLVCENTDTLDPETRTELLNFIDKEVKSLILGTPEQSKASTFIYDLFKPQEESIILSQYGISKHKLFNPVERKDPSNHEEFETMSITEFDDTTLKVFAEALKKIDDVNKREIEKAQNPVNRVRDVFSKVKGTSNNDVNNPENPW